MLACALNPSSNNVEVIDTYNVGYSNIRDTTQVSTKPLYYPLAQFKPYSTPQNVCPHFSNYTNGRISCRYVLPLTEPLLHHDVDTFLCSLQLASAELLIQGMSKTRTSTNHTIYCMEQWMQSQRQVTRFHMRMYHSKHVHFLPYSEAKHAAATEIP